MTPTLTVALPSFGDAPAGGWRGLIDLAVAAEEAGVDRVVVSDHVILGPNVDQYPWGRFPVAPDGAWLEPLTVLTAIAAATSRVRLATGILIAPLRPAAVLAKTVATLDQLSGGRVDLGVGTGWQREEYDAVGLDFDRRGQLLTETITSCRAFWEGRVPDVYCEPRPVQARLPIWFSGTLTPRNIRRIVELGDGWLPITGATVDDVRVGIEQLRTALTAAGRDPDALQVQGSARNFDDIPALAAAGVTTINVFLRLTTGTLPELVDSFAKYL
ncbi:MAG TPA: TIGR03619 family F420-dependent LLM class oxidoreductase [Acidimicrobiales bacterium]|nr:TIGR03619 family F420-dependent LLM class oxidoreductase [Acidimicrobiales bacterium]